MITLKPATLQPTLDKVTAATYALFMAGFFFIPNAVDQYKFYGFAVALPALFMLHRLLKTAGRDRLFLLIVAYLAWILASSFWSPSFSPEAFLKATRLAIYITLFLLVCVHLATTVPETFEQISRLLVIAATIAALASIPLWYSHHKFPVSRLVGMGTLDNPNPSAFVYGFFAVVSCHFALGAGTIRRRILYGCCGLALITLVFLTQSNTGILATLSAISVLFLLCRGHRLLNLATAAILVTGTAALLVQALGFADKPMDSGLASRIAIWEKVLIQVSEAPLLGHGLQRELILDTEGQPDTANYAHNALLASQRNGGLIATILHLLILIIATVTVVRVYKQTGDPALISFLVFGFLCMSTDTDDLVTRPRELWIIFWWPLAMMIAWRTQTSLGKDQDTSRANRLL